MKRSPKPHALAKKKAKPKPAKQARPKHHHKPAAHPKKRTAAHAVKPGKSRKVQKSPRAKAALGSASGEAYTPDHRDDRDHVYTAPDCRPEFVDLSSTMPPVWDQGDEGSCVAHGALAIHLYALAKAGRQGSTTVGRVYWDARTREGTTAQDAGSQVRSAVKACATGTDLEYLTLGPDALQACLSEGFPVVLGLTLFDTFEDVATQASGVIAYPSPDQQPLDGHCMVAVGIGYGYEWGAQFPDADPALRYVKLRNSWGTDVHRGGHVLMPTTYIRRHAADLWTMRAA